MTATFADSAAPSRIPAIDWARGIAVYVMALYHLAWDTNNFGFTDFPLFSHPFCLWARTLIISAFLFLAGLSITLAMARERASGAVFLRRWAAIAVGAGLVTLGTYVAFPESYVFFGVLHCIALSIPILLVCARLPAWAATLAGLAIIIAPELVADPAFDSSLFLIVGFGTQMRQSVDYVPLFPWTGVMLLGLAYGSWRGDAPAGRWTEWTPAAGFQRFTTWVGRHTLVLYILHQPLLVGLVWLAAKIIR